uniref:Uncharacterized protein n=1 Tax=Magallana gigas TaxID=29159 RepID=K1PKQ7_MAGGI
MAYNPDKGTRSKEGDTLSKDVTAIPGIGEINGDKLRAEGCYTVGDVLNKYKELGSKDKFLEWLDSSVFSIKVVREVVDFPQSVKERLQELTCGSY